MPTNPRKPKPGDVLTPDETMVSPRVPKKPNADAWRKKYVDKNIKVPQSVIDDFNKAGTKKKAIATYGPGAKKNTPVYTEGLKRFYGLDKVESAPAERPRAKNQKGGGKALPVKPGGVERWTPLFGNVKPKVDDGYRPPKSGYKPITGTYQIDAGAKSKPQSRPKNPKGGGKALGPKNKPSIGGPTQSWNQGTWPKGATTPKNSFTFRAPNQFKTQYPGGLGNPSGWGRGGTGN